MPVTFSSRNEALLNDRHIRMVPLLVITTYSDRTAGTVDETFYLSDRGILVQYDGAVRQFEPFVAEMGSLSESMPHLPTPEDFAAMFDKTLEFKLSNQKRDGTDTTFYEAFRAKNIEMADCWFGAIFLEDGDNDADMSALAEVDTYSNRVALFEGVVEQVYDITSTAFSIRLQREHPPVINSLIVDDPLTADPRDLGKRVPYVYGSVKKVPAVGWDVGFATTLAETISSTQTGLVYLSDTTGYPTSGTFDIFVNGEKMTCNGALTSATQISITTRGVSPTIAAVHAAGETVLESTNAVTFLAAAHECDSVGNIYVRNPYTGDLVLISNMSASATPTVDAADTTTVSGETVASIIWTSSELEAMLVELSAQAAVTQQPVTTVTHNSTGSVTQLPTSASGPSTPGFGANSMKDGSPNTYCVFSDNYPGGGPTGSVTFPSPPGTTNGQTLEIHMPVYMTGASSSLQIRVGSTLVHTFNGAPAGTYYIQTTQTSNVINFSYSKAVDPYSGQAAVSYVKRSVSYVDSAPSSSLGTPAAIEAASVGYGLEVFADVDGVIVPSPSGSNPYIASVGALIERPKDVMRHYIEERTGTPKFNFDIYSETTSTTDKCAFVESTVGDTFEEILGRVAYEAFLELYLVPGSINVSAPRAFGWTSIGAGLIDDFGEAIENGRDSEGFWSRWRVVYDIDYSRIAGSSNEEDPFDASMRIDGDVSDIAASPNLWTTTDILDAEKVVGRHDNTLTKFITTREEVQIKSVMNKRARESVRIGSTVLLRSVPFWFGFRYYLTDTLEVKLPWWSAARGCKVLSIEHNWESMLANITVVELP